MQNMSVDPEAPDSMKYGPMLIGISFDGGNILNRTSSACPFAATPAPKKSKEGEDDGDDGQTSEEDDGVTLDNAVFKTAEVVQLEADSSYQEMLKQTVKQRKQHAKDKRFKELRMVIRSSAAAARQAYALVAKAQTDTPSIKTRLFHQVR